MKIHLQPIVEIIRFFPDDKEFKNRDDYMGVATAILSHEGEEVYVGGAHITGLTMEHFELVCSAYTGRGVKRIKWIHNDKHILVDLVSGERTSTEIEKEDK